MKTLLRLVLAALLAATAMGASAQRTFQAGELESLLAPIALYPDTLLLQVLDASQHPQDVATAAAWARANPQLSGDAALATVQGTSWAPSVKALCAYPEVLARMAESPQWLRDLGDAYATYGPNVMATVQDLRARAQASGYLQSDEQQQVSEEGQAIVVQPASPNVVYVPSYDPYVVYGGWTWGFQPVIFRPFVVRPHVVTRVVFAPRVRWFVHPGFAPHRFVHHGVPIRAVPGHAAPHRAVPHVAAPALHGGPAIRPYHAVPESRRAPIIHSGGPAFIQSGTQPQARIDGGRRFDGHHFRSGNNAGHRSGHSAGHRGRR
jgi:hypothetical protein